MKHNHNFRPARDTGADPHRRLRARVLFGLVVWVLAVWVGAIWLAAAPLLDALGVQ